MFAQSSRVLRYFMQCNIKRCQLFITCSNHSLSKHNFTEIVSFDDLRFQKHLQFLTDIFNSEPGSQNISSLQAGYNLKILEHICILKNTIEKTKLDLEELTLFISDLKKQKDELYKIAETEKKNLEKSIEQMKSDIIASVIPCEIADDSDIIMELNAGVGGQEAMLFANDMFNMYCNYACWKGWGYEILKYETTDLGGIRCANLAINGKNAFKFLKFECGVHRVQRVPKTEKSGRIHTSTMTVAILPQPSEIDIVIHPNDIELEFKRSKGAGGQSVNTTDSCVRIYHKSSGIVAECQIERDQHKNRALAMKTLRAKLYERELEARLQKTISSRKLQVGSAARSEKVRTYNFVQDRITDHRAHINANGIESFLKGTDGFEKINNRLQEWHNIQLLMNVLNKYD